MPRKAKSAGPLCAPDSISWKSLLAACTPESRLRHQTKERAEPQPVLPHAYYRARYIMASQSKPLAVITGASTGIGYELAKCCAANDFDLVVVADEPEIKKAAKDFEAMGAKV